MGKYSNYNRDPRSIDAKFDCVCAETGMKIKRGDPCIYYPVGRKVFHPNSEQARTYREWKADLAMGYDY